MPPEPPLDGSKQPIRHRSEVPSLHVSVLHVVPHAIREDVVDVNILDPESVQQPLSVANAIRVGHRTTSGRLGMSSDHIVRIPDRAGSMTSENAQHFQGPAVIDHEFDRAARSYVLAYLFYHPHR